VLLLLLLPPLSSPSGCRRLASSWVAESAVPSEGPVASLSLVEAAAEPSPVNAVPSDESSGGAADTNVKEGREGRWRGVWFGGIWLELLLDDARVPFFSDGQTFEAYFELPSLPCLNLTRYSGYA